MILRERASTHRSLVARSATMRLHFRGTRTFPVTPAAPFHACAATTISASLKQLVSEVEDAEPDGEMYDAKIRVLSEYVKHHVKEEQNEMFPKAKSSGLNLVELGTMLSERKAELHGTRP